MHVPTSTKRPDWYWSAQSGRSGSCLASRCQTTSVSWHTSTCQATHSATIAMACSFSEGAEGYRYIKQDRTVYVPPLPLLDTNRLLAEVSEFTFPTVSVVGGTFGDIPGKPCTDLLLQDRPELLNDTRGLLSTAIRNPIGYFPFISFTPCSWSMVSNISEIFTPIWGRLHF